MTAKLISSIRFDGKSIRPVEGEVILLELTEAEFARLSALGAVVAADKDDLKLGVVARKLAAVETVAPETTATEAPKAPGTTATEAPKAPAAKATKAKTAETSEEL